MKKLTTEAGVPSNIAQFAKRNGIMPLVNKVAKWAKALNTAVIGGTAIGKGYGTLVLELGHYKSRVYVDIDDGTIAVNGKDVNNLKSFKQALELRESKTMKLTKSQLREIIREEIKKLNENKESMENVISSVNKLPFSGRATSKGNLIHYYLDDKNAHKEAKSVIKLAKSMGWALSDDNDDILIFK